MHSAVVKVSKVAKISNRYNQVPHISNANTHANRHRFDFIPYLLIVINETLHE